MYLSFSVRALASHSHEAAEIPSVPPPTWAHTERERHPVGGALAPRAQSAKVALMRTFVTLPPLMLICSVLGCGGYRSIAPGMSTAEVNKEMGGWTVDKIVPFGDGYSASYYNNDTCILFKDERVIAKDQGEERRNAIALGGMGIGAVEVCHALCVPPNVSQQRQCDTSVYSGGGRR